MLGLLLAAMAAGQLLSFGAFERALDAYALSALRDLAGVLVIVEIVAAAGLLASASVWRAVARAAGLLGLAVAGFWTALAAQAFARGLELDNCGCFGAYLAQPLRWWVLLEDAYMLVLAWYAAGATGSPFPTPTLRLRRTQEAT